MPKVRIIGGGLAGCEAAWQAALCGVSVELFEMRPHRSGPAHKTDALAELVCSNSLRGAALENAVGLLKEELAQLDSLIVSSARAAAVPAGGALAVDRQRFAQLVQSRLQNHAGVEIHRQEVIAIDPSLATIVACGPLPSQAMLGEIDRLVGGRLHYYDAASPIVAHDSIDESLMYRKSRYEKGDGDDYINIPLDKVQYLQLVSDLCEFPKHVPKEFEADALTGDAPYFEGCLPIEEMARRGQDTLRFGPLKPVGLRDPKTGQTPYAVVQLRRENVEGTAFNLVGFQTRLTWPAQKEVFGKLPGLQAAEWLRLGVMHRNTFIDSPRMLDSQLRLRGFEQVWFAGQITGAEGYVEAAACGAMSGIAAARQLLDLPRLEFPGQSAFGAVVAHLQNTVTGDFQPANVTWAPFPPLSANVADKRERRAQMAARALTAIATFKRELARAEVSETLPALAG